MDIGFIVIDIIFVVAVLALLVYALFELTPLAHHADHYRDSLTGRRRFQSPHLDD